MANDVNKSFVVLDGKEGKQYDFIVGTWFSPDGNRLAYPVKSGDKWLVVVDGIEGKSYDDYTAGTLTFSPDGKHFAYLATLSEQFYMIIDGKEEGPYVEVRQIQFSPDGKRMAYIAYANNAFAVIDGKQGENFVNVGNVTFSPDGKHTAYIAVRGNKNFVVADEKWMNEYDEIVIAGGDKIIFDSPESFHYLVVKGTSIYLVEESF
ncbi:MAG: hypothetical protein M5T52_16565 [Ignavibacteriaceae bacterium]|nr:hypothetical protein [Ignavibacteriaceae bacterium]